MKTLTTLILFFVFFIVRNCEGAFHTGYLYQNYGAGQASQTFSFDFDLDSFDDLKIKWIDPGQIIGAGLNGSYVEVDIANTDLITKLQLNALVGNQGWNNQGNPNEPYMQNGTIGNWNAADGYVGFKLSNGCKGWVRVALQPGNDDFQIVQWGYNDDPLGTIRAGQTTVGIETINFNPLEFNFDGQFLSVKNIEKYSGFKLSVLNNLGQKETQNISINSSNKIDLGNLPIGIYFIEIEKGREHYLLRKLFVSN